MSSIWAALFRNSEKKERTGWVLMKANDDDEIQRRF
jgi:hypothetical protein